MRYITTKTSIIHVSVENYSYKRPNEIILQKRTVFIEVKEKGGWRMWIQNEVKGSEGGTLRRRRHSESLWPCQASLWDGSDPIVHRWVPTLPLFIGPTHPSSPSTLSQHHITTHPFTLSLYINTPFNPPSTFVSLLWTRQQPHQQTLRENSTTSWTWTPSPNSPSSALPLLSRRSQPFDSLA